MVGFFLTFLFSQTKLHITNAVNAVKPTKGSASLKPISRKTHAKKIEKFPFVKFEFSCENKKKLKKVFIKVDVVLRSFKVDRCFQHVRLSLL